MGVHTTIRKWLLNQNALTDWEILVSQCAITTLMGFMFLVLAGEQWNELAPMVKSSAIFWIAVVATTFANAIVQWANVRAFRLGDQSLIAPISALTPGLVVISAALLGEVPSVQGYAGIVCIIIFTYAHIREGQPIAEYFKPLFFWRLFIGNFENLLPVEQKKRMGLRYAYLAALFATLGLLGDGLLARHGDMLLGITVELLALTVIYGLFMSNSYKNHKEEAGTFGERFKVYWKPAAIMGILFGLPFILLGVAFRLAPIAYIGSLKRLSILLTVLLGAYFLKESFAFRRTILAGGIVVGAMLLAFDPTQAKVLNSLDAYTAHVIR